AQRSAPSPTPQLSAVSAPGSSDPPSQRLPNAAAVNATVAAPPTSIQVSARSPASSSGPQSCPRVCVGLRQRSLSFQVSACCSRLAKAYTVPAAAPAASPPKVHASQFVFA